MSTAQVTEAITPNLAATTEEIATTTRTPVVITSTPSSGVHLHLFWPSLASCL